MTKTIKEKIEALGFTFFPQLNEIDEKLVILETLLEGKELTKECLKEFLEEKTEWAICNHCGRIEKSSNLKWTDECQNYENEWITINIINAFAHLDAVCDVCFDRFGDLTYLSIEELHQRLSETPHNIYRPDDTIITESSKAIKILKIHDSGKYEINEDGTILFESDIQLSMVDYCLCNEFAQVVDLDGSDINYYDNWNTINGEGQPEIKTAIEDWDLKEEFIAHLKTKGYDLFIKYL